MNKKEILEHLRKIFKRSGIDPLYIKENGKIIVDPFFKELIDEEQQNIDKYLSDLYYNSDQELIRKWLE